MLHEVPYLNPYLNLMLNPMLKLLPKVMYVCLARACISILAKVLKEGRFLYIAQKDLKRGISLFFIFFTTNRLLVFLVTNGTFRQSFLTPFTNQVSAQRNCSLLFRHLFQADRAIAQLTYLVV